MVFKKFLELLDLSGPELENTQQDFLQEAESLIAQHHKGVNESKAHSTSIDVFKKKHHKSKTGKYLPFEIKKSDIPDVVQEHRTALRNIGYPKDTSKFTPLKEPTQEGFCKEQNIKEKFKPVDIFEKEKVNLGKIMTDIESVSKKMEKEKQLQMRKFRTLEPIHSHTRLPFQHVTSSMGLLKEPVKLGEKKGAQMEKMTPVSLQKRKGQEGEDILGGEILMLVMENLKPLQRNLSLTKTEWKSEKRLKTVVKPDKLDKKVKRIGPHIEIYQVFQEKNKRQLTKKITRLITVMQAFIRGWLERKRLQRIKTKASYHGPSLKAVITMYQCLIHRVRHRLGLWRTKQIIKFDEVEEWMDRKKFYETMFAKREDWQGLDRGELLKYFNDCGHFPTQAQVDEFWNLYQKGIQGKYSEVIKKSHAVELLFTLYPPEGAKVSSGTRLRSTWLRPLVDGEEGYKYIVNGHPILKRANIRTVGKLVARSIRERKMRQVYKS
ncbi:IQ domain-containing protein M [Psammomys obesus]|uniref:IQ domain-containing protein M n=1 Tax=Psammomys obesus TaxID=48139 RepID=UPI0024530DD4|nr:IQ domain-containing protein M [Psammomys obesus]